MSNLTKYPEDPVFKARLKTHGFCLDDPDRRYPARNEFPAQVLNLRSRGALDRAAQLLNNRQPLTAPNRSRFLPWGSLLAGLFGWPEIAKAHDHHRLTGEQLPFTSPVAVEPTSTPPMVIEPAPIKTTLPANDWAWILDLLSQADFANPTWGLPLGVALLATQVISVAQRKAILNASAAKIAPAQPDLFPDTIELPASSNQSSAWTTDAASRQGQVRSENQDAFQVIGFDDGSVVLVICDGAGGIGGGREASQSAVASIETALHEIWEANAQISGTDLESAIAKARQVASDQSLEGVTTALLVLLDGHDIHYATLGDGAVAVVWPDGMIGQVQVPHHTLGRPSNEIGAYIGDGCKAPPRTGRIKLEPGAIVLAMSDGASDLFSFDDFARDRHEFRELTGLADLFLAHLEAARDPDTGGWLHSDNMTLAMARLDDGGGNDTAN